MSTAKSPLYIGNHTTSSKGYTRMARQMIANGGNAFAFFTRNPRGGRAKEIDPEDVRKFLELTEEYKFGKIVSHAPYVLNGCSELEMYLLHILLHQNIQEFPEQHQYSQPYFSGQNMPV